MEEEERKRRIGQEGKEEYKINKKKRKLEKRDRGAKEDGKEKRKRTLKKRIYKRKKSK